MSLFCVGDVVANSLDPFAKDFYCGSIMQISTEHCAIWCIGNGCLNMKTHNVVLLRDVLKAYPHAVIIADKEALAGPHKRFIGGRVSSKTHGGIIQYCIDLPGGYGFISHKNSVRALDALEQIDACIQDRCTA